MSVVKTLETQLEGVFKSAPPLPDNAKKSLVNAWPWIALVFGVLQILAALSLWGIVTAAERAINVANTYSMIYTGQVVGLSAMDKTVIFLGVALLFVDAILLLKAYPELKKRTRKGWDLLFLASLLNAAYAVITLFINQRGVGGFLFSVLGSAIGFYLLFQVKNSYHTTK